MRKEDSMNTIRYITEYDIPPIIDLLQELNKSLEDSQLIDQRLVIENLRAMEEQKDTYENLVYINDGLVIGFISLLFYRSVYHRRGTAQINELIVKEGYRDKGIGKELLEYGIRRAKEKGMDEIEIGVEKGNTRAIQFYKKNGIEEEYLLLGKEFEK